MQLAVSLPPTVHMKTSQSWWAVSADSGQRSSVPNLIPSDQNVSTVSATQNVPDQQLSRYTAELGEEKGKLSFFIP